MVNSNKIKKKIAETGKSQADCAKALGIKTPTFNQKVNNVRSFTLPEADALCGYLGIEDAHFRDYFFYSESCDSQRNAV